VQLGQAAQRRLGAVDRAARDLVALDGGRDVLEHERERSPQPGRTPTAGSPARGPPIRAQAAVEADLAVVGAELHAGRAARVVGGGELTNDARRSVASA